ncbi:prolyl-tRNA synthetase [Fervidicella metallireducens AeB]|uniref:Proline--tRNA ligase n=1 Tax=Fervidicella metallireducens AeB TaxID=1403537 RepID=A0A017RT30_9CLOT|nr:proline--tRNA ligase [Fervidicella metallireducens]EYE87589.1 prolyl-tRNA synthetase [Fervidicella metallireducens AeB]
MRFSAFFIPTLREMSSETDVISQQLLLRGGFIRKVTTGVYNYLPLGLRVLRNIEKIIREELNLQNCQEVLFSTLQPSELYQQSNYLNCLEEELFKFKDKNDRECCLPLVQEEMFVNLIKGEVKSYKNLPLVLYQINRQFRDETKSKFGIINSREIMAVKACSFDATLEGMEKSFEKMKSVYDKIFNRCGLKYNVITGSLNTNEYITLLENGDDKFVYCENCNYMSSLKNAKIREQKHVNSEDIKDLYKVETIGIKTIEDLSKFLGVSKDKLAKTMIYKIDKNVVAVMVRGDREVNNTKIMDYLNCTFIEMADEETVERVTGSETGFAGPIGLMVDKLLVDYEVAELNNMIVGANQKDFHLVNVNYGRDFIGEIGDFRNITEEDSCPICGEKITITNGIVIGQIQKSGDKHSQIFNAKIVVEEGFEKPLLMGGYEANINKIISAVVEQNHDEKGIIWPLEIAPFQVIIIPAVMKDELQVKVAEEIYEKLKSENVSVIIDDRDERIGVKFNDADLIGIPIRVTVGKKAKDGLIELKLRNESEVKDVRLEDTVKEINNIINLQHYF